MRNITQLNDEQTLLTMIFERNKIIAELQAKYEEALREIDKLAEKQKEDQP